MTEAPHSLAQTPDGCRAPGPDLLSEMLRAVRVSGSVFLNACFSAPFGLISPKIFDEGTPMARLRHISVLHLVVEGAGVIETAGGERREVAAGDIIFMPFADRHKFWAGAPERWAEANDIVQPGPIEGMSRIEYGGGGEPVRLVCGFVESEEFLFAPVFRTLPALTVERTGEDKVGAHVASAVTEIVGLVDSAAPGTQALLGRLMELLFLGILRRHIAGLPAGSRGWFAALNDPVVGRALQLLHADPARRWTVDEIARRTGSSRTVLAGRFKRCSAAHQSTISRTGGSNWRVSGCASDTRAFRASRPAWAMNPKPRSCAPSNASAASLPATGAWRGDRGRFAEMRGDGQRGTCHSLSGHCKSNAVDFRRDSTRDFH
jgi:uncharacterized cupin superfamily protein